VATDVPDRAPHRRAVRIHTFLGDTEVFPARIYMRTVDLSAEGLLRTEAHLNQDLEQVAIEHGQERPAGDYRLVLRDNITGEHVMDWRYVPRTDW
jgi:hypothetical protein